MLTTFWCDLSKNDRHCDFSAICTALPHLKLPLLENLVVWSPFLNSDHMGLITEGKWPNLSKIGFFGIQDETPHSNYEKFGVLVNGNWPVLKTVVLSSFLGRHKQFQGIAVSQLACLKNKWSSLELVYD